MDGLTLEWQVFLRGIEKRIQDMSEEISRFSPAEGNSRRLSILLGQLSAFQEVRDYILGEMK